MNFLSSSSKLIVSESRQLKDQDGRKVREPVLKRKDKNTRFSLLYA